MAKLSMCRICLSDDTPLRSIVRTQLQEVYESLTMMPFVAEDTRPVLVCYRCCERLEDSSKEFSLKEECLRSEKLFTELLQSNVLVNLQVMPEVPVSTAGVSQVTPDVFDSVQVKQENAEDIRHGDREASHSQDGAETQYFIKIEPDPMPDVTPVEPAPGLEWDVTIVKEEPHDVDPEGAAVGPDDGDPCYSAPGLHTECDITLDIVKEEPDDVDTGTPPLAAQRYQKDTRTDHTMDNVEERKREKRERRHIKVRTVNKKKRMKTGDDIDIRLRRDTQNSSTAEQSDDHTQMCENKTNAEQIVNSSASDKLTELVCDTCQKCFKYKSKLTIHMRTHTGEKPYECNVCKKCFSEKGKLVIHTRTHTGDKRYECNVCKKCFTCKSLLLGHIRIHTGEKPYQCDVCQKCFNLKGSLNKHILMHTGEKPYECEICKKAYILKGHLVRHLLTHTGEKPYECNICKKCFVQKGKLMIHIRTHTGEKPYECNVCKKRFTQKSSLHIHSRTHTGEKPYKCNVCTNCFSQKCHLTRHVLLHTSD